MVTNRGIDVRLNPLEIRETTRATLMTGCSIHYCLNPLEIRETTRAPNDIYWLACPKS